MGRLFALLLAAAIVAGAGGAKAADLLPPPPPMEPPPPVEFGGWYLRGDVGVGAYQMSGLRSTFDNPSVIVPAPAFDSHSIGDGAFAGAGVGYQFNNWFRFDVTGEYRTAVNFRATQSFTDIWGLPGLPCGPVGSRCFDIYNAQTSSAVFLANAYFDLGTWYGITPFVGGGVGVANHWFEQFTDFGPQTGGYGWAHDKSQANFAWQVGAGLAYNVTPNLKLEVAYRYLDMGKVSSGQIFCRSSNCPQERQSFNLVSNDIRVGFRYVIPSLVPVPPPPPPPPLVRKY